MDNGESKRVQHTKRLLSDALIGMLRDTPLYAVSIRDLCSRAGVNRTTFYNHYGSQYDLLNDVTRRFMDDVAGRLASADPESRESIQERVTTVFAYLEEHLSLSRLLLGNNADPHFAEKLFSLPKITDLLHAALGDLPDGAKRDAVVSFAIHGSYRLLLEWLDRDDRLPPDRQAALILELARRVCGQETG